MRIFSNAINSANIKWFAVCGKLEMYFIIFVPNTIKIFKLHFSIALIFNI